MKSRITAVAPGEVAGLNQTVQAGRWVHRGEAIRQWLQRARLPVDALAGRVGSRSTGALAVDLTAFLVLVYGSDYSEVAVPVRLLAVLTLLMRSERAQFYLWTLISVVMIVGTMSRILFVDNHKVLLCYWCMAIASLGHRPEQLARTGRLLIGIAFAFATFWKLASGDFLDGALLRFELLTDGRFAGFASFVTGIEPSALDGNREMVHNVLAGHVQAVELHSAARIDLVARAITFYTVFIEGLVAVAFLVPARWRLAKIRNWALIVFVLTVYSVATVIGFAWVLCIMGYSQTGPKERLARIGYLTAFLAAQFYLMPWRAIL